jgi:hypothetical protein
MSPNSLESGVHTSTKEEVDGPPPNVLVKFSIRGHRVQVEFISLSQELTNFFSLNLEL